MAKKEKKENKSSKKKLLSLIITLVVVIGGAVGGYFVAQKITENDKFAIIGEKVIEIEVGEEYVDEGAIVISFGKNISDKIIVENTIDNTTVGEYYIRYTVDNFRFKGVERYRIIKVVEVENEGI